MLADRAELERRQSVDDVVTREAVGEKIAAVRIARSPRSVAGRTVGRGRGGDLVVLFAGQTRQKQAQ
jgi:hypothetical protein